MTLDFYAFVSESEDRKIRLGIDESPEVVDAMRNKGGRRTEGKRSMLARAADRARSSNRPPVEAYY